MLKLVGRQREGGEYLDHDVDNQFVYGGCSGDLGINIERFEEVFDRFEQLEECIVTGLYPIGGLVRFDVRRRRRQERKKKGYMRQGRWRGRFVLLSQVGMTVEYALEEGYHHERPGTYEVCSIAQGSHGGKRV